MSESTTSAKQTSVSVSKKQNTQKEVKINSQKNESKEKKVEKKKISQDEVRKMIYGRISDAYSSEKGQGFIVHLIKSFFPAEKTNHALVRTTEKMTCCITNKELMTHDELKNILKLQNQEEVNRYVAKKLTYWQGLGNLNWEFHPFDKLMGGKYLALKGEKSDKYLCEMAWQELRRFIINQGDEGNKHIVRLVRSIVENKPVVKVKKPISGQAHVNPKAATQSLGDNDVLKKLNEKLNQK